MLKSLFLNTFLSGYHGSWFLIKVDGTPAWLPSSLSLLKEVAACMCSTCFRSRCTGALLLSVPWGMSRHVLLNHKSTWIRAHGPSDTFILEDCPQRQGIMEFHALCSMLACECVCECVCPPSNMGVCWTDEDDLETGLLYIFISKDMKRFAVTGTPWDSPGPHGCHTAVFMETTGLDNSEPASNELRLGAKHTE